MQFVRFRQEGGPARWGYREGPTLHRLDDRLRANPTVEELTNPSVRERIARLADRGEFGTVPEADVTRLAPVPRPGKIIALGLNYHDHAEESGGEVPEVPLMFSKAPTSVTRPGAPIVYPDTVEKLDYEVELAIVIGRTARRVDAADAADCIAGYTVVNDISARAVQFADEQWFRSKSFDTFTPMGPRLATAPEFDPVGVDVSLRVNGDTKQSSNTEELIFGPSTVVAYASDAMTLEPGDVIATGTPAGVGVFRDPPELLEPGDTVAAEVEGIGTLENSVVAES